MRPVTGHNKGGWYGCNGDRGNYSQTGWVGRRCSDGTRPCGTDDDQLSARGVPQAALITFASERDNVGSKKSFDPSPWG